MKPVATKIIKPVLKKVVVKPTKALAKNVSTFFFGPEGTQGFAVRFKSPELGGFLKAARRQPGGTQLEDVVTLLHKSVVAIKDSARKAFSSAEDKVIKTSVPNKQVIPQSKKIIGDFLHLRAVSERDIAGSGLSDAEVRIVQRIFRELNSVKKLTSTELIRIKRIISSLYRGTEATKQSDAIITQITHQLNAVIEKVDPVYRKAMMEYASEQDFLKRLGINIVGKSKYNVEQTANKLYGLAKDLDDPFKKEASEALLKKLGERTGINYLQILTELKTAINLSPQKSMGIRAGVVRELARIMQVMISEGVAVAGRIQQGVSRFQIPEVPSVAKRIFYYEALRELFKQ